MNKKIYKGYELAQAVDNGILNLEQKVKSADNMTYYNCTIDFVLKDVAKNIIFENFKLIEDNTEEIEEIELIGTNFMDMDKNQLKDEINKNRIFINKLRQEIFELRKDKDND